jgi:hypothetical protein
LAASATLMLEARHTGGHYGFIDLCDDFQGHDILSRDHLLILVKVCSLSRGLSAWTIADREVYAAGKA